MLTAAFSVLAGCTQLGPAERESLRTAAQLLERGDTSGARQRLDRLIHDFRDAVEIAEAYYLRGLCRTREGALAGASEDFQKAVDKSKRSDLTARSKASLAAIAYRHGDWAAAASLYEEAVGGLPDRPPTDEVLYHAGIAFQRAGKWREARTQFARVLSRFRDRPIAVDARRVAGWSHDYFAIQLGAYRDVANAEKAVQSFRAKGLPFVVTESHPRGDCALWVVMSGQYPTYREAVARLDGARAVSSQAYIIPRP